MNRGGFLVEVLNAAVCQVFGALEKDGLLAFMLGRYSSTAFQLSGTLKRECLPALRVVCPATVFQDFGAFISNGILVLSVVALT